MKLLTALTVATGLSFAAVPAAFAETAAGSPATLGQIEGAQTAQIVEVDAIDFEAPEVGNLNEVQQALTTNPSIESMLESNDIQVQDVVAVTYDADGALMIYYVEQGDAS